METIDLNTKTEEGAKMSERVKILYDRAAKVLSVHASLNRMAMAAVQFLGYNGFKRWHCHNAKCFFKCTLKLATALYDKFRIKADFKEYELSYAPKGMEEHLRAWEKTLLEGIQELGSVQKDYCEETGTESRVVSCAIEMMSHDRENVGRYLRRFTESDWLALDMHIVDDRIHDKYKRKEEEEWKPMKGIAVKS